MNPCGKKCRNTYSIVFMYFTHLMYVDVAKSLFSKRPFGFIQLLLTNLKKYYEETQLDLGLS